MSVIGFDAIAAHEHQLLAYATEQARAVSGLRLIGTARDKASILSFVLDGVHPHDVGTILDGEGVAVRTGHHCAMPVMEHFHVPATVRASFALYNTRSEVDRLAGICQQANPQSVTSSFRQALQQFGKPLRGSQRLGRTDLQPPPDPAVSRRAEPWNPSRSRTAG